MAKPEFEEETASPQRNFSLRLEDRIRAMDGPAAFMRRKREIEDIEADLQRAVRSIARVLAEETGDPTREDVERRLVEKHGRGMRRLNELIETHNRYYPAEANLPVDVATGEMLDRGVPWRPLAPRTAASLYLAVFGEAASLPRSNERRGSPRT